MKKLILPLSFLFMCTQLAIAQISPEQEAVIKTYEGFPPVPFEAPDLDKKNHFLPKYVEEEKVVLMAFWETSNDACIRQIESLNKLVAELGTKGLAVVSFAYDEEASLKPFLEKNKIDYPIIANSKGLADMAYAGELGNPRIFIIDTYGIIKKVYVGQETETLQTYNDLKPLIESYF